MAAPVQGFRVRVERLLRNDFRTDDFTKLFLYPMVNVPDIESGKVRATLESFSAD
jgi:hypothetical protein